MAEECSWALVLPWDGAMRTDMGLGIGGLKMAVGMELEMGQGMRLDMGLAGLRLDVALGIGQEIGFEMRLRRGC